MFLFLFCSKYILICFLTSMDYLRVCFLVFKHWILFQFNFFMSMFVIYSFDFCMSESNCHFHFIFQTHFLWVWNSRLTVFPPHIASLSYPLHYFQQELCCIFMSFYLMLRIFFPLWLFLSLSLYHRVWAILLWYTLM